jgi:hypothetical protein
MIKGKGESMQHDELDRRMRLLTMQVESLQRHVIDMGKDMVYVKEAMMVQEETIEELYNTIQLLRTRLVMSEELQTNQKNRGR